MALISGDSAAIRRTLRFRYAGFRLYAVVQARFQYEWWCMQKWGELSDTPLLRQLRRMVFLRDFGTAFPNRMKIDIAPPS